MPKKSKSDKKQTDQRRMGAGREIIESIVIAFVLAFLFRTFEAEAFVIPTGSMASTLMGVHKDVTCEACGFQYQVGASQEEDAAEIMAAVGGRMSRQEQNKFWNDVLVNSGTCPNCRYEMELRRAATDEPTYQGDRILVSKFAYQFDDPQRWDVIVFRYPKQSWTNYIKRLVGLPGETLDVRDGDIFVKPPGGDEFAIARKPSDKLMAMARVVHDTEFVPMYEPGKAIYAAGWPLRWQAAPDWLELINGGVVNPMARINDVNDQAGQFVVANDYKSYSADGTAEGLAWLRYRHTTPDQLIPVRDGQNGVNRQQSGWEIIKEQKEFSASLPAPKTYAIQDFLAYNAGEPNVFIDLSPNGTPIVHDSSNGTTNWVGDLIFEASLDVADSQGQIVLEAVEGGYFFRCTIDVATGEAVCSMHASSLARDEDREMVFDAASGGEALSEARATTSLKGAGKYRVRFANVDDQLRLWVGEDDAWGDPEEVVFDTPTTYASLPMGLDTDADKSAVGIGVQGTAITVSKLRLLRDTYYTQPDRNPNYNGPLFVENVEVPEGKLFAMGDNSDRSKDSRYFGFVDIENELIGKALYVYWPHAWSVVWPNFDRMSFVR